MNRDLRDMGVAVVSDVAALPRPALLQKFGERSGHFLYFACRGKVGHGPA
jgi:nucleotidyltransferase/DNA polymerase involved in DNA repair